MTQLTLNNAINDTLLVLLGLRLRTYALLGFAHFPSLMLYTITLKDIVLQDDFK